MKSSLFSPNNPKSINQKFREKRFKFFLSLFEKLSDGQPLNKPIQILDVGGTEIFWEHMNFADNPNVEITLLNLFHVETKRKNFKSIIGDACDLSDYQDNHFDIVFSNSVIEHLFTFDNQKKMAQEIMRVGKNYYIQTPNYYFPIEPHWVFPFFQFLPFGLRVFLTQNFNLGHKKKTKNKKEAMNIVNEVKLLTEKKMKNLFPDGKVYREIFLWFFVKSITMYRFNN
ncbi:MAG: class I SAM-dependent methyltransferase [Bacteroidetes bacterium]|nr:class I SAM-dependent methyltransferase [Bacteroidota bacterium]